MTSTLTLSHSLNPLATSLEHKFNFAEKNARYQAHIVVYYV